MGSGRAVELQTNGGALVACDAGEAEAYAASSVVGAALGRELGWACAPAEIAGWKIEEGLPERGQAVGGGELGWAYAGVVVVLSQRLAVAGSVLPSAPCLSSDQPGPYLWSLGLPYEG